MTKSNCAYILILIVFIFASHGYTEEVNKRYPILTYGPTKEVARAKGVARAERIAKQSGKKYAIQSESYSKFSGGSLWKCRLNVRFYWGKKEKKQTRSFITFEKRYWKVSYFDKIKLGYGNVVARLIDRIKVVGLGTYGQSIIDGYLVIYHVGPGWARGDALLYKIQPIPKNMKPIEIFEENYIKMKDGNFTKRNPIKDSHYKLLKINNKSNLKQWKHNYCICGEVKQKKEKKYTKLTPYSIYKTKDTFSIYIEKDGKKMYSLGKLKRQDNDTITLSTHHKIISDKKVHNIRYKILYSEKNDKFLIKEIDSNFNLPILKQCIAKYSKQFLGAFKDYFKNKKNDKLITCEDSISKDIYNAIFNPQRLNLKRKSRTYHFNFGGDLVGKSYGSGTVYQFLLQIKGSSGHWAMMVHKIVLGHMTLVTVQGRFWGAITIAYN